MLDGISRQCDAWGYAFHPVQVRDALFENAPVTRQYPKEMYYRLLASHLLPGDLKRVLYLDPDILVINPIRPLWEMDLQGNLFAAAAHTGKTELANNINQLRLGTENAYFNSGVLLMDLEAGRREIIPQEIFRYVEQHRRELILPDQDILNGLYGSELYPVEESLWNYDARRFDRYQISSQGEMDMDWVMDHTAVLHFCGKRKPWNRSYQGRFAALYKHYRHLAERQ